MQFSTRPTCRTGQVTKSWQRPCVRQFLRRWRRRLPGCSTQWHCGRCRLRRRNRRRRRVVGSMTRRRCQILHHRLRRCCWRRCCCCRGWLRCACARCCLGRWWRERGHARSGLHNLRGHGSLRLPNGARCLLSFFHYYGGCQRVASIGSIDGRSYDAHAVALTASRRRRLSLACLLPRGRRRSS